MSSRWYAVESAVIPAPSMATFCLGGSEAGAASGVVLVVVVA